MGKHSADQGQRQLASGEAQLHVDAPRRNGGRKKHSARNTAKRGAGAGTPAARIVLGAVTSGALATGTLAFATGLANANCVSTGSGVHVGDGSCQAVGTNAIAISVGGIEAKADG